MKTMKRLTRHNRLSFPFALTLALALPLVAQAQRVLTLDSVRAMALTENKQLKSTTLKLDVATNTRKAIRTKRLPKVDAVLGYEYFNREVSILNNGQKSALSNLGTNAAEGIGTSLNTIITDLVGRGVVSPEAAQQIGAVFQNMTAPLAEKADQIGGTIRDAFRTDSRNMWAGAVTLRQPIYMGGAITAANRMADINEQLARNEIDLKTQETLYDIDHTYWLVVSLRQKHRLAESYLELVKKLDDDVHKMIDEGVATRADGLKVDVKVNEAEMQLTQAENGLSLSRMLLCQLCGLPLNESFTLADEQELSPTEVNLNGNDNANVNNPSFLIPHPSSSINPSSENGPLTNEGTSLRPELRMLENAIDISRQTTKLIRAEYMPHVALTGGYLISNPNVFNGFERRFSGVWNVGVLVQVPVWNWFEGSYKVRASQTATTIAMMDLADAREKIDLQVSQCQFKLNEAEKKLAMTQKNILSAEENLRCANVGFREGVMESTDVMAAQTAWQMAQTQRIDAEIELRLAQVNLKKALGTLR